MSTGAVGLAEASMQESARKADGEQAENERRRRAEMLEHRATEREHERRDDGDVQRRRDDRHDCKACEWHAEPAAAEDRRRPRARNEAAQHDGRQEVTLEPLAYLIDLVADQPALQAREAACDLAQAVDDVVVRD